MCLVLGVVIAGVLGADLGKLSDLRLRHTWSVFAALAFQIVDFSTLVRFVPPGAVVPVHLGSYVLIAVFLVANARVAGMPLVALGWLANLTAIVLNGGRMPISLRNWVMAGEAPGLLTRTGVHNNNVLANHGTLTWLGDIFPLPRGVPLANVFSIGDVLIVAGAVAVASLSGRSVLLPQAIVAPLKERAFVRLVTARGLSQLGDWITMSAAVTWIYAATENTWWVSGYLIARVLASLTGGAIGHRLLGRPGRERFRILLVVRALFTAAAMIAGIAGSVPGAIALLVASAVLAPTTNAGSAGLVPATVPASLLHRANAVNGVILEFALVAGAAVGGLLETHLGLAWPLAIDVVTFVVAASVFSNMTLYVPTGDARDAEPRATFRTLARRLLGNRAARPLLVSFAVATAAVGTLNASLPRFLAHIHAGGGYGVAMACVGAGAMLGGLLVGSMSERRAIQRSVALGFFGIAAALMLLAAVHAAATVYLVLLLIGLLDATTEVSYATILQQSFADRDLPALLTLASCFISGGMIAGYAAAGLTNAALAPGSVLYIPAATCGAAALIAIPLALLRPHPPPHPTRNDLAVALAKGVLTLPAFLTTRAGTRVALVAEVEGRWLAYPSEPIDQRTELRLLLPGYEFEARATADHDHGGHWVEISAVKRRKPADVGPGGAERIAKSA